MIEKEGEDMTEQAEHGIQNANPSSTSQPPPHASGEIRTRKRCCANCVNATRPAGRWFQVILSRFAGLLICADCGAARGELRGVAPGSVCRNFRLRHAPAVRSDPPGPSDGRFFYIPLTQGQYAIVDAEDYERVSQFKWCISRVGHQLYAYRKHHGKTLRMHQFIMNPPKGMVVDHIDGNGLDNRRGNLRICTRAQNAWNQTRRKSPNASSQYVGVHRHKHRPAQWYVMIQCDGAVTNMGPFDTEIEAARARDYRVVEVHGPYAHVNLPDEWPPERRTAVMAAARIRALALKPAVGSRRLRPADGVQDNHEERSERSEQQ
jgi:hypothetical protein